MIERLLIRQILTLFLIMSGGFALVKAGKAKGSDSRAFSVANVYILMPCVLINAFRIQYTPQVRDGFLLVLAAAVLEHLVFLLVTYFFGKKLSLTAVERASLLFPNCANLIVPLVTSVLGEQYLVYSSAFMCVQSVILWTYGISLFQRGNGVNWKGIFLNANIIAIFAGLVMMVTGLKLPPSLENAFQALSNSVGPVCMLMIGMVLADMDLKRIFRYRRIWLVFLLRMILLPALCCLLLHVLPFGAAGGDTETLLLVTILAAAAPSATVIVQIAQLHGEDEGYAGAINAVTTLGSIITMPLMVWFFRLL